jgi:hypothetical protein
MAKGNSGSEGKQNKAKTCDQAIATYIQEFLKTILVVLQSDQLAEASGQRTMAHANASMTDPVEAMLAGQKDRVMSWLQLLKFIVTISLWGDE